MSFWIDQHSCWSISIRSDCPPFCVHMPTTVRSAKETSIWITPEKNKEEAVSPNVKKKETGMNNCTPSWTLLISAALFSCLSAWKDLPLSNSLTSNCPNTRKCASDTQKKDLSCVIGCTTCQQKNKWGKTFQMKSSFYILPEAPCYMLRCSVNTPVWKSDYRDLLVRKGEKNRARGTGASENQTQG